MSATNRKLKPRLKDNNFKSTHCLGVHTPACCPNRKVSPPRHGGDSKEEKDLAWPLGGDGEVCRYDPIM